MIEEKKVVFKNKKRTRIVIEYYSGWKRFASARVRVRSRMCWEHESMPMFAGSLLCSFDDFNTIMREYLYRDKVARRWFRRKIKRIVVDPDGTRLGDFFLPSGRIDVPKIKEYDQLRNRKRNQQLK